MDLKNLPKIVQYTENHTIYRKSYNIPKIPKKKIQNKIKKYIKKCQAPKMGKFVFDLGKEK